MHGMLPTVAIKFSIVVLGALVFSVLVIGPNVCRLKPDRGR
jgi:hypothetical protein